MLVPVERDFEEAIPMTKAEDITFCDIHLLSTQPTSLMRQRYQSSNTNQLTSALLIYSFSLAVGLSKERF